MNERFNLNETTNIIWRIFFLNQIKFVFSFFNVNIIRFFFKHVCFVCFSIFYENPSIPPNGPRLFNYTDCVPALIHKLRYIFQNYTIPFFSRKA